MTVINLDAMRFRMAWRKLPRAKRDEMVRVASKIFQLREQIAANDTTPPTKENYPMIDEVSEQLIHDTADLLRHLFLSMAIKTKGDSVTREGFLAESRIAGTLLRRSKERLRESQ